jgi:hypothetical protein
MNSHKTSAFPLHCKQDLSKIDYYVLLLHPSYKLTVMAVERSENVFRRFRILLNTALNFALLASIFNGIISEKSGS